MPVSTRLSQVSTAENLRDRKLEGQTPRKAHFSRVLRFSPRQRSRHHCQQLGDLLRVAGGVGSDATAEAVRRIWRQSIHKNKSIISHLGCPYISIHAKTLSPFAKLCYWRGSCESTSGRRNAQNRGNVHIPSEKPIFPAWSLTPKRMSG